MSSWNACPRRKLALRRVSPEAKTNRGHNLLNGTSEDSSVGSLLCLAILLQSLMQEDFANFTERSSRGLLVPTLSSVLRKGEVTLGSYPMSQSAGHFGKGPQFLYWKPQQCGLCWFWDRNPVNGMIDVIWDLA